MEYVTHEKLLSSQVTLVQDTVPIVSRVPISQIGVTGGVPVGMRQVKI